MSEVLWRNNHNSSNQMIAQCPHCKTKYSVPGEKIPAKGRKAICKECQNSFVITSRHNTNGDNKKTIEPPTGSKDNAKTVSRKEHASHNDTGHRDSRNSSRAENTLGVSSAVNEQLARAQRLLRSLFERHCDKALKLMQNFDLKDVISYLKIDTKLGRVVVIVVFFLLIGAGAPIGYLNYNISKLNRSYEEAVSKHIATADATDFLAAYSELVEIYSESVGFITNSILRKYYEPIARKSLLAIKESFEVAAKMVSMRREKAWYSIGFELKPKDNITDEDLFETITSLKHVIKASELIAQQMSMKLNPLNLGAFNEEGVTNLGIEIETTKNQSIGLTQVKQRTAKVKEQARRTFNESIQRYEGIKKDYSQFSTPAAFLKAINSIKWTSHTINNSVRALRQPTFKQKYQTRVAYSLVRSEIEKAHRTSEGMLSEMSEIEKAFVSFKYVPDDGTVIIGYNTWQQNPDGQKRTWEEAGRYCRNLELAGYNDWKLPSYSALYSLFTKHSKPAIDTKLFPKTQKDVYWTSDESRRRVRVVHFGWFNKSTTVVSRKTNKNYVRCVRDTQ